MPRAERFADFDGDLLVLSGDVPGLSGELLRVLIAEHRACGAAATVLSFRPADTRSYGRIVRGPEGRLARIVEAADATEQELSLGEVNSGIYLFRAPKPLARARAPRVPQHPGRAVSHRHDRSAGRRRGRGRGSCRARPVRGRGRQHAGRARRCRRRPARPHQHPSHARGRDARRPRLDRDPSRRRDRARRDDPAVCGVRGHHAYRDRCGDPFALGR